MTWPPSSPLDDLTRARDHWKERAERAEKRVAQLEARIADLEEVDYGDLAEQEALEDLYRDDQ